MSIIEHVWDILGVRVQRRNHDQQIPCSYIRGWNTTWASNCYVRQAKVEFGEDVASRLKLSADRTKVLWPQPTDSPLDPQNWNPRRKVQTSENRPSKIRAEAPDHPCWAI
ncbi:hypothetical protein B0H14DRAFT_2633587 [Mycena olivaceomarginata]|nr:hypothetical protein B0H14DRAFT_2633587 [Mycena olivaceomarginata]